jgi:hypothetical protein
MHFSRDYFLTSFVSDPAGEASKASNKSALTSGFVLFNSLDQASLAREFYKTKIPPLFAGGLI